MNTATIKNTTLTMQAFDRINSIGGEIHNVYGNSTVQIPCQHRDEFVVFRGNPRIANRIYLRDEVNEKIKTFWGSEGYTP